MDENSDRLTYAAFPPGLRAAMKTAATRNAWTREDWALQTALLQAAMLAAEQPTRTRSGLCRTTAQGDSMSYDEDALRLELIRDEGKRLTPYRDTMGLWTVGIGHLLKRGEPRAQITERQCLDYFIGDVVDAEQKLDSILPGWRNYGDARQRALVNLAFNLGWGLKQFVNFLAAMEREDYASAGRHLRASKWTEQVKNRAPRIIHMIVTDTAWEGV